MTCWTEDIPELPGVYKLTNKVNGKIYIGESENVAFRIKKYPSESKDRTIIRAIKKYGWNNFQKEVIEVFPIGVSKSILRTRETFWIKFLRSHAYKNGYNEIEDTIDPRGTPLQERRKFKIKNNLIDNSKVKVKGFCKPPNYQIDQKESFKSQPVYQLDIKTGEILKEWPSVRAAAVGLSGGIGGAKAINGVIKGEYGRKSYYGFGWRFVFPETNGFNLNSPKTMSEESCKRISESRKGKYSGQNNHMFGKRLTEEQKQKISLAKTGIQNPLKWVKICQIDIQSKEIIKIWDSITEACRTLNIDASAISECLHKKRGRKSAKGFFWEFAEKKCNDI